MDAEARAAEYWKLARDAAAVALVRARTSGDAWPDIVGPPRIPVWCTKGHDTGVAIRVTAAPDQPNDPFCMSWHLELSVNGGKAEGPPVPGGAWVFTCKDCGKPTKQRDARVLGAALKALGNPKSKYRISLT
ncbi:hypothetical protein [Arthrobacter sp. S39]|uniref:hypothetical protein n=1 Tax=Arthrobacter sp. S39 TaxID=2509720 RepID=UPI001037AF3B|nr:hypothetical protein [Arthrobacter sp. S39]TAP45620.1 hypothetical protein EYS21_02575 [Arthrobacter sp. S39]